MKPTLRQHTRTPNDPCDDNDESIEDDEYMINDNSNVDFVWNLHGSHPST